MRVCKVAVSAGGDWLRFEEARVQWFKAPSLSREEEVASDPHQGNQNPRNYSDCAG